MLFIDLKDWIEFVCERLEECFHACHCFHLIIASEVLSMFFTLVCHVVISICSTMLVVYFGTLFNSEIILVNGFPLIWVGKRQAGLRDVGFPLFRTSCYRKFLDNFYRAYGLTFRHILKLVVGVSKGMLFLRNLAPSFHLMRSNFMELLILRHRLSESDHPHLVKISDIKICL